MNANKPRIHILGLFHTKTNKKYSHCAFTGKVLRFSKMMQKYGYYIIEYSNEESESGADEHVTILSNAEFDEFYKNRLDTDMYGQYAIMGSEPHLLFEKRLEIEMNKRMQFSDLISHPFGQCHQFLLHRFPNNFHIETGIGYNHSIDNTFKIYESYAWLHYNQGKDVRYGKNYEWVVPNYFDLDDWEPCYTPGNYFAFLGRICEDKGLATIREIANYSKLPIKICGQGDPNPWKHPNIIYGGTLHGKERSDFLRNARAVLMPTQFVEPFGGSGVEGMLCGTPLIAVDNGAFTETIIDGVTGYRCHTLQDWLHALDNVEKLDRRDIANITRSRYSLETCGEKYDKIFKDIHNLRKKGWYELEN
jgi:glycosyltransferase involved in cell wall biosynthesis